MDQMNSEFSEAASQIKVPPEMQESFQRVVVAGMKIMYAEESKQLIEKELNSDKPMSQKLAESIVGLMVILWQKSNQSIPPQLIIPAALTLLIEAAEFMQDAGQDATPEDVAEASMQVVQMLLEKFGAKPEKIQELFNGGFDQQAALQAGEQQGGGLVQGAMQGGQA